MRAAEITSYDQPPRLVERPEPAPVPGEVLVRMDAVGVHQLVRARAGGRHYSVSGRFPAVVGVDGVGTLPDGRAAWVFTMPLETNGTLAELVAVPEDLVVRLPEGMDPMATAASVNPMMAAWMSLFVRGNLQSGQHLAVLGATGGSGVATLQLARGVAGHVTAVARNAEALQRLLDEGLADEVVVLGPDQDAGLARVAAGADVVVDYLWGPVAEALWQALGHDRRPGHRLTHVEVGTMAGPDATLPGTVLRSADLAVIGSAPGAYSREELFGQIPALLQRMASDGLSVPHAVVPFSQLDAGWARTDPARTVFDLHA